MYLKKTPNPKGRIRLSIVDSYYDKKKKCSRQITVESLGFLDELQEKYDDPTSKKASFDNKEYFFEKTNYYFETEHQDDFLHKGVSKEHRPNPIVQMGLFMDNKGLPVTYELFAGNTNDCLTCRPNFGRIKKLFDLGRVISVADKGMATGDNIWYTINTPTKDGYVFSMSVRDADKELKSYVLNGEGDTWLGGEYKRKSRRYPRTIQVTIQGKHSMVQPNM